MASSYYLRVSNFSVLLALLFSLFIGCKTDITEDNDGQVAQVTFSPAGGTYTSDQSVSLATTTSGATIYYTTDSSEPNANSGTLYSSAIDVNACMTIKAFAIMNGMVNSQISSAEFIIDRCGNDVIDTGEECDTSNLQGKDCYDLGFTGGGNLSCTNTCTLDTSACIMSAICGDGVITTPEQCDDGNLTLGDGCNDSCQLECYNDSYCSSIPGLTCNNGGFCEEGCTNGSTRCTGNIVETCNSNTYSATTDCSASGMTCSSGSCIP